MFLVFAVILRQVDWRTGLWFGSAKKIRAALREKIGLRTIQDSVRRLSKLGYLKSFHKNGARENYTIAVDRYPISMGKWAGHRLDALAMTNSNAPVYVADAPDTDSAESAAIAGDAPLMAAQAAFDLFSDGAYGDMDGDEKTALQMVLWTIYRAAAAKNKPTIPTTLGYYEATRANLMEQHEHGGWENVLDTVDAKFDAHAFGFVGANNPALLEWLTEKRQELWCLE